MLATSPIRIQVISDIHAEFGGFAVPHREDMATDADIVLVAGDIASAPDAVHLAVALFRKSAALILIGGNHEHYRTGMTVDDGLAVMREAAEHISAHEHRTVAVLEDDAIIVSVRGIAVRVLGSTFWTDYGLLHQPFTHAALCESAINDRAKNGKPWLVCVSGRPDLYPEKAQWNGHAWVLGCRRHFITAPPTHYKPLDEPPV